VQQEMCTSYLLYYPKLENDYASCLSGDYSSVNNTYNFNSHTLFCGSSVITNYQPVNFTPYSPPDCPYLGIPVNESQAPSLLSDWSDLGRKYEHSLYLDTDGKYRFLWTIDFEADILRGAVIVETDGWIGWGLTDFGMAGADVFIAWIQDDGIYFMDRFAEFKGLPTMDLWQDYFNIFGAENVQLTHEYDLSTIAALSAVGGAAVVSLCILCYCCWVRRHKGYYALPYVPPYVTDAEDSVTHTYATSFSSRVPSAQFKG